MASNSFSGFSNQSTSQLDGSRTMTVLEFINSEYHIDTINHNSDSDLDETEYPWRSTDLNLWGKELTPESDEELMKANDCENSSEEIADVMEIEQLFSFHIEKEDYASKVGDCDFPIIDFNLVEQKILEGSANTSNKKISTQFYTSDKNELEYDLPSRNEEHKKKCSITSPDGSQNIVEAKGTGKYVLVREIMTNAKKIIEVPENDVLPAGFEIASMEGDPPCESPNESASIALEVIRQKKYGSKAARRKTLTIDSTPKKLNSLNELMQSEKQKQREKSRIQFKQRRFNEDKIASLINRESVCPNATLGNEVEIETVDPSERSNKEDNLKWTSSEVSSSQDSNKSSPVFLACKKCNASFHLSEDHLLRHHMLIVHGEEVETGFINNCKRDSKNTRQCIKCSSVVQTGHEEHKMKCLPFAPTLEGAFKEIDERNHKCGICLEVFKMRYELKNHIQETHESISSKMIIDPDFRCAQCLQKMEDSEELSKHCVTCSTQRPSDETVLELAKSLKHCDICQSDHDKIPDAFKCYYQRGLSRCYLCLTVAKDRNTFQQHLKMYHLSSTDSTNQSGSSIICPICGKGPDKYSVIFPHISSDHYSAALLKSISPAQAQRSNQSFQTRNNPNISVKQHIVSSVSGLPAPANLTKLPISPLQTLVRAPTTVTSQLSSGIILNTNMLNPSSGYSLVTGTVSSLKSQTGRGIPITTVRSPSTSGLVSLQNTNPVRPSNIIRKSLPINRTSQPLLQRSPVTTTSPYPLRMPGTIITSTNAAQSPVRPQIVPGQIIISGGVLSHSQKNVVTTSVSPITVVVSSPQPVRVVGNQANQPVSDPVCSKVNENISTTNVVVPDARDSSSSFSGPTVVTTSPASAATVAVRTISTGQQIAIESTALPPMQAAMSRPSVTNTDKLVATVVPPKPPATHQSSSGYTVIKHSTTSTYGIPSLQSGACQSVTRHLKAVSPQKSSSDTQPKSSE